MITVQNPSYGTVMPMYPSILSICPQDVEVGDEEGPVHKIRMQL